MPTYDYRCDACGHEFEAFQSMTARPLKKCPECEAKALKRLIGTGAGIIFKGSGFYETDYRSSEYKKAAEADKPASASDGKDKGGESSKKADAKEKPAAKSESKSEGKSSKKDDSKAA